MVPIVINLIENSKRRDYILSLFPNSVRFFNGVNGKKFRLKHAILTPEAVSCFLSHTTLWLQLLEESTPDDMFLIMEDDVKPLKSFTEIQEKIKNLPEDWDIALLGWFSEKNEISNMNIINEDWIGLNSFWGMQAYLIKKSSILKIYQSLINMDDHIDIQLARLIRYRSINGYFLKESAFSQESFESQIPKIKN